MLTNLWTLCQLTLGNFNAFNIPYFDRLTTLFNDSPLTTKRYKCKKGFLKKAQTYGCKNVDKLK